MLPLTRVLAIILYPRPVDNTKKNPLIFESEASEMLKNHEGVVHCLWDR